MGGKCYLSLKNSIEKGIQSLAILIDPEKFNPERTLEFLNTIPSDTTHLFVGGSFICNGETEQVVKTFKQHTRLPVFLFPGDYSQITDQADAILFLNLISGRNPEYLIEQQVKSIPKIVNTGQEVISTGYILIDGGNESSVSRITDTKPLSQNDILAIVDTALAGWYMGAKLIYLEAGSGAKTPVKPEIIRAVKKVVDIPIVVGGGIRSDNQKHEAFSAGADMVVMGTAFENEFKK